MERNGHIVARFVGGITEHHALVAGALVFFVFTVDTTIDVATLLMNGREDSTGVAVELIFRFGITNLVDGAASHRLQVDIGIAGDFAHDNHLTRGDKRLDGTACMLVVSQELIEDGVTNLVGHFVGMAFRY